MSGGALALVLVAAVCHAVWNIAAKRVQGDGYVFVWCYQVGSAVLWTPVALVELARAGWPATGDLLIGAAVSAVIHIGYALALQTGYERADLGVVYPVARGVGPLLTVAVAVLVLGERPGWVAILGALVIVTGIVITATGRAPRSPAAPAGTRRGGALNGVRWGAITGAAIAAYTLWDDHSVTELGLLPLSYFVLGNVLQVVLLAPGLRRAGRASPAVVLRRWRREVVVVSVLSPLAYVLVLEAMRSTPVSLVAPTRESSIVVGSLLAWWLFKEPSPVRRLLGSGVVLLGIVLVTR